jgi:hypothetical protein
MKCAVEMGSGAMILSCVRGSVTNNNGFWIGWLDLLALLLQSLLITIALQQLTISDCLRLAPFCWTVTVFSSIVTDLVLIYESLLVYE